LKLSIIVPAYNEARTIREILRRVREAPLEGMEREILVVDDGSTDGTRELLQEEERQGHIFAFYHPENRGKGAAVRTGLEHAKGDIVLIQDADLEYDPRDYAALIAPIREGRAQVVYGSRFQGSQRTMFLSQRLANRLLTLTTNLLYGSALTDMETCYKVFAADLIKSLPLRARGFEIEPEITAKVLKGRHRIHEVPVSYTSREYREGKKINWRDGLKSLWWLVKYRFVD